MLYHPIPLSAVKQCAERVVQKSIGLDSVEEGSSRPFRGFCPPRVGIILRYASFVFVVVMLHIDALNVLLADIVYRHNMLLCRELRA